MSNGRPLNAERQRLENHRVGKENWRLWGPYLSERAWGTVREDYSAYGDAWDFLPHDHARSRAYRWSEDGLGGISDENQFLCLALALWNGRDPFLKERAFGLTGPQGNRGEDVKEYYFYLDATPSHSYLRYLYKYPQAAYPYERLVEENARRDRNSPPFNLLDTGVFDGGRYFDVDVIYSKAGPEEIHVRIVAHNRGPETAELHLLPTLWFRNTWSWGDATAKPRLSSRRGAPGCGLAGASRPSPARHVPSVRPSAGRAAVHRKRKQRRAAVGSAERDALCQGRVPSLRRRWRERRGQPGALGHEVRRLAQVQHPGRSARSPRPRVVRASARDTVRPQRGGVFDPAGRSKRLFRRALARGRSRRITGSCARRSPA